MLGSPAELIKRVDSKPLRIPYEFATDTKSKVAS